MDVRPDNESGASLFLRNERPASGNFRAVHRYFFWVTRRMTIFES
jgi:hypothetical protein